MTSRTDTASKSLTFLGGLAIGGLLTFLSNRDTENQAQETAPKPRSEKAEEASGQAHLWQPPQSQASASSTEENSTTPPKQPKKHLWIVFGPSGSGKTTMATFLAKELSVPYLEGDDYHSAEAKLKMTNHHPLDDNDRWPWLERLRNISMEKLRNQDDAITGIVITCSALKQRYRDVMRIASFYDSDITVRFLFLKASEEELLRRVRTRQGHYMKEDMVRSQMSDLQQPADGETDVVIVDVDAAPEESQRKVLEHAQERQRIDLV